jgi:hypothetical protein
VRHRRRLRRDLRFYRHHGILQEPGSSCNVALEEADVS